MVQRHPSPIFGMLKDLVKEGSSALVILSLRVVPESGPWKMTWFVPLMIVDINETLTIPWETSTKGSVASVPKEYGATLILLPKSKTTCFEGVTRIAFESSNVDSNRNVGFVGSEMSKYLAFDSAVCT